MTRILDLQLLGFDMLVRRNEDWLDAWAYVDTAGQPISLAGLVIDFAMAGGGSADVLLLASTAPTIQGLPVQGTVVTGGVGQNVMALRLLRPVIRPVPLGRYRWEAQGTGDGFTRTIGRGEVEVEEGDVP